MSERSAKAVWVPNRNGVFIDGEEDVIPIDFGGRDHADAVIARGEQTSIQFDGKQFRGDIGAEAPRVAMVAR